MEYDLEYQKYLTKVKDYGGWVLEYVPKDLRTEEVCLIAVKQNPYALEFVPEEFKTEELCELAVNDGHWALEFVPKEFKTKELCEIAVKECLKWIVKYELENLFEKSIPSEFQEGLAEKYDIELPEKSKGILQEI